MRRSLRPHLIAAALPLACLHANEDRIILDPSGVESLGIELTEADESHFEQTLFALGHIEVLPGRKAIVSSRIPGRAFSVLALPHQFVDEGDELMWVESRQPGDPPPTIMLEAPMSGLIARVNIAPGQPILPDQSLIEILDLDVVEATASVPQHLVGQLELGQSARIRVTALPEEVFTATLAHLGVYADEESGTLEASFHIENPGHRLRPGMRAEFTILTSQRKNVMSIPRDAVQGNPGARFVYVADFELPHAFLKVPVQTGDTNDERIEITAGLLPGDEVVVRGAYMLGFAGKGSVSLKEALDAAHGHPHNEDGTEMTAEQAEEAHDHDHGNPESGFNALTLFFAATSALLLILLLVASLRRREVAA